MPSEPMPSTEPAVADGKKCPFCAETIQVAAIKCRFCGERLDARDAPPAPSTASALPSSAAQPDRASAGGPLVATRRRPSFRAVAAFVVAGLPAPFLLWRGVIERVVGSDYQLTEKTLIVTGAFTAPVLVFAAIAFVLLLRTVSMSKAWAPLLAAEIVGTAAFMTAAGAFYFVIFAESRGFYLRDASNLFIVMLVGASMAVGAGHLASPQEPSAAAPPTGGRPVESSERDARPQVSSYATLGKVLIAVAILSIGAVGVHSLAARQGESDVAATKLTCDRFKKCQRECGVRLSGSGDGTARVAERCKNQCGGATNEALCAERR